MSSTRHFMWTFDAIFGNTRVTKKRLNRAVFVLVCLLSTGLSMSLAETVAEELEEPIDIGSRLELFVDSYLIDKLEGAELRLHSPQPREVAIVFNEPWEGNGSAYVTVFQDGDIFRMYYRCLQLGSEPSNRHRTCYAESQDGKTWTKPDLGLWEYEGSTHNNILWPTRPGGHNFTAFKDENPNLTTVPKDGTTLLGPRSGPRITHYASPYTSDPTVIGRYKAIGGEFPFGVHALKSDDGIHWSYAHPRETALINGFDLDSQNVVFWDTVRGEYRMYFRHRRNGLRDIMTATSRDFLDWSESKPVWLEFGDTPAQNLYTNAILPYDRAPHIFLGFPMRMVQNRQVLPNSEDGVSDSLFMTSRDGLEFNLWGEAIIRPGPLEEGWISRSNLVAWGLLETKADTPGAPDELSIYALERTEGGRGQQLRRYAYRLDGFVSVRAPLGGGELITKPLLFEGGQLVLNLSTSAAGSVAVEIQTLDGKPVKGFSLADSEEFYGDAVKQIVTWKGGSTLDALAGTPIRLRFVLKDADLYSFQFR